MWETRDQISLKPAEVLDKSLLRLSDRRVITSKVHKFSKCGSLNNCEANVTKAALVLSRSRCGRPGIRYSGLENCPPGGLPNWRTALQEESIRRTARLEGLESCPPGGPGELPAWRVARLEGCPPGELPPWRGAPLESYPPGELPPWRTVTLEDCLLEHCLPTNLDLTRGT